MEEHSTYSLTYTYLHTISPLPFQIIINLTSLNRTELRKGRLCCCSEMLFRDGKKKVGRGENLRAGAKWRPGRRRRRRRRKRRRRRRSSPISAGEGKMFFPNETFLLVSGTLFFRQTVKHSSSISNAKRYLETSLQLLFLRVDKISWYSIFNTDAFCSGLALCTRMDKNFEVSASSSPGCSHIAHTTCNMYVLYCTK